MDTKQYSNSVSGGTETASAKIEFDNSVSGGFEIGANNEGIENLRIGASYNRMKFDMHKVTEGIATDNVVGVLDDTYTGDMTSSVRSAGISLHNSVNLYMVHAYYDIKNSKEV
jgi:hypothetical protein